jgi:O-antigen ligase
VRIVAAVVLVWGTAATVFGLLQFLGWVHGKDAPLPGDREPSFLGVHDFAALSGAVLCLAFVGIVLGGERPLVLATGAVAGGLGAVLSGAAAGALGIILAAAAAVLVARARDVLTVRRLLAVAGVTLAVAVGVVAQRGDSISQFARFLGILHKQETTTQNVQSYAHRSLLLYIGLRIWEGKPIFGAGYHGSEQQWVYGPYLDDAHRRFPDEPAYAFPSPAHPWGVQNAYVETLADLGIVGFALLTGLFASGLLLAGRAALRAPPAVAAVGLVAALWLIVGGSVWNGLGLYAGLPILGLLWLAFGLAAVAERDSLAVAG